MSGQSVDNQYFDKLYEGNDDPWAMRHRWYERRKRALLLACLPKERYGAIFEPGCANGETSLALATRCDALLSCDMNTRAVGLTQARLSDIAHAQARQAALPADWPSERFDLIVLNELGYYLSRTDLSQVIEKARACLNPGGQVVACHWLASIEGAPQTATQVHEQLHAELGMHRLVEHREGDFLLELWSCESTTVAQHEGLR
ncbi:class I SAM-dependent methyltransferase [Pseudomonas sp. CFBP 13727]|uniref:class I SAM-dependent methyltransferase n=1 Tax=Pseudomonas sp. CFBP 13727 TaxID=2775295 RepID=UPI001786DE0E|nr:SAM-dependent methyltransferase [Pseudomonas sp. CFBP 13727]MBD8624807.1 methyltransferase domain-containing protein [Pseudomonas sp. CFBP 13727]